MKCPYCQHENIDDALFCAECGKSFQDSDVKEEVVAQPVLKGQSVQLEKETKERKLNPRAEANSNAFFYLFASIISLVVFVLFLVLSWSDVFIYYITGQGRNVALNFDYIINGIWQENGTDGSTPLPAVIAVLVTVVYVLRLVGIYFFSIKGIIKTATNLKENRFVSINDIVYIFLINLFTTSILLNLISPQASNAVNASVRIGVGPIVINVFAVIAIAIIFIFRLFAKDDKSKKLHIAILLISMFFLCALMFAFYNRAFGFLVTKSYSPGYDMGFLNVLWYASLYPKDLPSYNIYLATGIINVVIYFALITCLVWLALDATSALFEGKMRKSMTLLPIIISGLSFVSLFITAICGNNFLQTFGYGDFDYSNIVTQFSFSTILMALSIVVSILDKRTNKPQENKTEVEA